MTTQTCDVVVLGMGTCGEDASLRLADAGVDVVGIEERLIGGECPFWACIPSKFMVGSANLVTQARRADGLVGRVEVDPDWTIVASRIRSRITGGWEDSAGVDRFESRGGRFIRGRGRITAPRTVEVGDTTVFAERGVLLATGSRPMIPPIPGLAETPFWTNHEAIAVEELPASLAVLGGGPVGCELGQVFARFGVEVTFIEAADRLLGAGEPEASDLVAGALEREGATLRLGVRTESVASDDDAIHLALSDGTSVTAERLLVATGRTADTGSLGIESAGAKTNEGFVEVDQFMRAAEGLWAIGDVTGKGLLTEIAEYQGLIAVEDILGASPLPACYDVVPTAVFTDPEVGSVGMTEADAKAECADVEVQVKDLSTTFRGWTDPVDVSGMIKVVVDRDKDRLLGATVVGPRGTEVIGFLALAIQEQIPLANLVHSIYAFPTYYGGVGEILGAYGRGITRVLDPGSEPMFGDPPYSGRQG